MHTIGKFRHWRLRIQFVYDKDKNWSRGEVVGVIAKSLGEAIAIVESTYHKVTVFSLADAGQIDHVVGWEPQP